MATRVPLGHALLRPSPLPLIKHNDVLVKILGLIADKFIDLFMEVLATKIGSEVVYFDKQVFNAS
ncbi:hypothetical protein CE91St42_12320 [Oscillospiraceae bacterium]|nr:hypothetical protein CE91St42_12320 [Oscillospiraceae bacterium]